jgi:hypothetical protein
MPAKSLSTYPASVKAYTDPAPFDKAPDLVIQIARAIGLASTIESILEMLLAEMLGASADPVAAVIGRIRSAATVREMILEAACAVLPQDEIDIFEIILATIATAVKPRDVFAHQIWEWSPDIDGILFTHKSQIVNMSLQFGRMVRGKEKPGEIKADRAATLVFTRADIAEV